MYGKNSTNVGNDEPLTASNVKAVNVIVISSPSICMLEPVGITIRAKVGYLTFFSVQSSVTGMVTAPDIVEKPVKPAGSILKIRVLSGL